MVEKKTSVIFNSTSFILCQKYDLWVCNENKKYINELFKTVYLINIYNQDFIRAI